MNSSRILLPASAACLCLLLAGCGPERGGNSDYTLRDSANVRIVEYATVPRAMGTMALSSEPLYQHGLREDDHLFQIIWAGALQPDGGAVVADFGRQQVVLLGRDGTLRSVLAGSGRGPAEVSRVMTVHVLGQDTILIEDDGDSKIMIFEGTDLNETVRISGNPHAFWVQGVDSAGDLLMTSSGFEPGFEQEWLEGNMVRLDLESGRADTVGVYDWVRSSPNTEPVSPFVPSGQATVTDGMFVHARSDRAEVRWLAPGGELRQIVRWNPEPDYPTEEHVSRYRESLRREYELRNPSIPAAQLDRLIEDRLGRYELDPTEPLPLFSHLVGDEAGGVWIGEYVPESGTVDVPSYTVIGPNGEWLGTVEAPPHFRLLDVRSGRVLGVLTDEMGVESVVVFSIETNGPAGNGRSR